MEKSSGNYERCNRKTKKKKKMKRKENGEVERQFREKHKAVHYSTPVSPF
jgi:hypothetical protein